MARKGMIRGQNAALVKAAIERQGQLRKLKEAERRDLELLDTGREKVAELLRDDAGYWYEQAKMLAETAGREDETRVKVVLAMLAKLIADRKEKQTADAGPKQPFVFQVIGDVKRGTLESMEALRRGAIDVNAE